MTGRAEPSDSVRAYFGWRLRHWRLTRGFTQAALGRELGYDHTFLSKIESGDRRPPPDLAERADRLLGADGELAALWPLLERERERRQTEPPPTVAASLPSRPLTATAPETMHRLFVSYLRVATELGGRDLVVPLEHHTRTIVQWQAGATGAAATELLSLAATFAELAGWARFDSADYATALFWYNSGHHWATLARDPALASRLLARQSAVHWSVGNAAGAIGLADAARRVDGVGPGMRAWACLAEARGHALAADRGLCEQRLAEAEDLLRQADADDEPWVVGVTDSVLRLTAGTCYRDLALRGRPGLAGRAVDQVSRSLGAVPADSAHDRALVTARLASALACAAQPDAAATLLAELLEIAHGSGRVRAELRAVHDHLTARWPSVPAVRDLGDRARGALTG
ncbi:helix-turn-helix domain-containing protein [Actinokineospora sp. 24-640]